MKIYIIILAIFLINLLLIEGFINGIQSAELSSSKAQNRLTRSITPLTSSSSLTSTHNRKMRRNIVFSPPKKLFEGARLYHNTIIIPKRKITKT